MPVDKRRGGMVFWPQRPWRSCWSTCWHLLTECWIRPITRPTLSHRIPARSFMFAGRSLPLCARCSGTYLGALAGLIVLAGRGRWRAAVLPAPAILALLGAFLLAWAVDGFNSFLTLIPGLPFLYEPHNLLRLITGTLEGLVIAAILLPVANLTFWEKPEPQRSVASWHDLAWMVAGAAVVIAAVRSEWPPLLYPLALLSGAAILGLGRARKCHVGLDRYASGGQGDERTGSRTSTIARRRARRARVDRDRGGPCGVDRAVGVADLKPLCPTCV